MGRENNLLDRISGVWGDSLAVITIAKLEYCKRHRKATSTHIDRIVLSIGVILGEIKVEGKGPKEFCQRFLREIMGDVSITN